MTAPHKQPKPDSRKYDDLIGDIEKGIIKIPKFQREFVWPIEKTAALLDSIVKGYPIGTFILWKTNQRMADVKEIGNIPLPPTPGDRQVEYVLDGQQRMTSLFAAYRGAQIPRAGTKKVTDFAEIYVDLDLDLADDDQIVITELPPVPHKCVPLSDVLDLNHKIIKRMTADGFSDEELDLAESCRLAFKTYDFSLVTLTREDIDSAIEVFTRINTGGSVLTLFEIMVAKTYDEKSGFDMQVEWKKFEEEIDDVGFDGIAPSTILSLLSLALSATGECKRHTILALDKEAIIDAWPKAVSAMKSAVDHFRSVYRIKVSSLLPYDALLVPFAYWFFRCKHEPAGDAHLRMREFFWRAALSNRYSSSTESKLAQDKKRVDEIIENKHVPWLDLEDTALRIDSAESLVKTSFATGNSLCKAILCLLAHEQPRNFHNDGQVLLDNSHLKIASSKNYHHFFPKAHLRDRGIGNENSMVNITLIGADLNKRQINARPPKEYIQKFEKANPTMAKTLLTHLVDRQGMGIDNGDYELFLKKRSLKIWDMISDRIYPVHSTATLTPSAPPAAPSPVAGT